MPHIARSQISEHERVSNARSAHRPGKRSAPLSYSALALGIGCKLSRGPMKVLVFYSLARHRRQPTSISDAGGRAAGRGHDVCRSRILRYRRERCGAASRRALRVLPSARRDVGILSGRCCGLRRLLRSERPDILYAFQPTQTALAALGSPGDLPTRLVFGIRAANIDASHYDTLSALSGWLEARLARRADFIIANSHAAASDAIARGMPADTHRRRAERNRFSRDDARVPRRDARKGASGTSATTHL